MILPSLRVTQIRHLGVRVCACGPKQVNDAVDADAETHDIPRFVVDQLPDDHTATEYVAKWDEESRTKGAGAGGSDADGEPCFRTFPPQALRDVEEIFLHGSHDHQLLFVSGEGGTGKSTFMKNLGTRLATECREHLRAPGAVHRPAPWTPVLLQLRKYSAESLKGALHGVLNTVMASTPILKAALEMGEVTESAAGIPVMRLLVLCDGTDEMADGGDGTAVLQDFVTTLNGGAAWESTHTLRVVATSRGYGRVPNCMQRVLLPFRRHQVREARPVMCTHAEFATRAMLFAAPLSMCASRCESTCSDMPSRVLFPRTSVWRPSSLRVHWRLSPVIRSY
jgi:hypothetical protein